MAASVRHARAQSAMEISSLNQLLQVNSAEYRFVRDPDLSFKIPVELFPAKILQDIFITSYILSWLVVKKQRESVSASVF
jgi:hypothetical protein